MSNYKTDRGLQRHTLWLFSGDFDRLNDLYPDVSASEVIRLLVRKHVEAIDNATKEPLPAVDFDI